MESAYWGHIQQSLPSFVNTEISDTQEELSGMLSEAMPRGLPLSCGAGEEVVEL